MAAEATRLILTSEFGIRTSKTELLTSPATDSLRLSRNHSGFAGVIEQATGVHNGTNFAQRFEAISPGGRLHGCSALVQIHRDHVTGLQNVAQAVNAFALIQFTGRHRVAEENAGEALGEDDPASRRAESDGRMLARTAAAEVFSADHNRIFSVKLAFLHEAGRIKRVRQTAK